MAVIVASLSHWLYVTGHQVRTLFILFFPPHNHHTNEFINDMSNVCTLGNYLEIVFLSCMFVELFKIYILAVMNFYMYIEK